MFHKKSWTEERHSKLTFVGRLKLYFFCKQIIITVKVVELIVNNFKNYMTIFFQQIQFYDDWNCGEKSSLIVWSGINKLIPLPENP